VFAQGTAEKLTYRGSETMDTPVQIESISLRVWWSGGGIKDPSGVIWSLIVTLRLPQSGALQKKAEGEVIALVYVI